MSRLSRAEPKYGNVLMDISLIWIKVCHCFISHKKGLDSREPDGVNFAGRIRR